MATLPSFTPTYDANGNVLTDSINTYAWDADGNSTTVGSVTLTFDALDRMVEQDHSGTYTEIVYAPTGAKLALMSGTGGSTLQKAFVPLPGKALAVYTSSGLNHYRHSDWLGSTRLTSSTTQTYLSSLAYDPFGGTYATSGTTDPSFTGQNPDTVSGDDDFLFREYSNVGRWVSPDPAGMSAVDPTNPQSWNRYAYVLNNPLANVDPLGLCAPNDYTCDTGSGPINNGGNSGDCSVDGAAVSCSSLSWNSGIYLLCPNNSCDRAAGGRDSNATPSPDPIPAGGSTR
jgi:RHS repeat-associated protein